MMKTISFIMIALISSTIAAHADDWCLPYNECMDDVSPIKDNSFETCEATCTMRDPIPVRGLDANIYDVTCESDGPSKKYRMMLGEYTDWNGNKKAYIVTPEGTKQLDRCPL